MSNIEYAYLLYCTERFQLPSEEQIGELEERIGVLLPDDYREFIREYNGGWFSEPRIFTQLEGCPSDLLTVMYGIGASHRSAELNSESHLTLFDDNYPAQILPIGYTIMGNLLFVITHPEDNGVIALKKAASDESFALARGIEEFFGLLRVPVHDE
jgi:hypothetical protein